MENLLVCPVCHTEVKPTDYFCVNCGNNLKPAPPSTSFLTQVGVYLESIFLPPYGIVLGIRYLRQGASKSKAVGITAIVLTVISLLILIKVTFDLINTINTQVDNQLQDINY